ncbi:hypothetical protein NEAUS03_1859 [Nematocida ausubeli]|nr:hypothetical protein NEAUS03_1859 [Nematocida ausubeli]
MKNPQSRNKPAKKEEIHPHLYDLSVIKSELDEILVEYLTELEKYQEDTIFTDIRIAIGIVTASIAISVFLLVERAGLNANRIGIIVLLVSFWILAYAESIIMKVFFYHTFSGTKDTHKVKVITKIADTLPIYTILIYSGQKKIPSKTSIDVRSVYADNFLIVSGFRRIIKDCLSSA